MQKLSGQIDRRTISSFSWFHCLAIPFQVCLFQLVNLKNFMILRRIVVMIILFLKKKSRRNSNTFAWVCSSSFVLTCPENLHFSLFPFQPEDFFSSKLYYKFDCSIVCYTLMIFISRIHLHSSDSENMYKQRVREYVCVCVLQTHAESWNLKWN